MKINIASNEWYPVYEPGEDGWPAEVDDATAERIAAAFKEFAECQAILKELYTESYRNRGNMS